MKLRIDGIYQCHHPNLELNGIELTCPDCPYEPRPSHLTLGGIIKVTNAKLGSFIVDRERDIFIISGDLNG